jgi:signal peptidase I
MENVAVKKRRRWWLAGLLSFLVPGLGQVYNGQATKGLLFYFILSVSGGFLISLIHFLLKPPSSPFFLWVIFLAVIFISLVLYLFIIFEAIYSAKKISGDYSLKKYNRWYIYLLIILVIRLAGFSVNTTVIEHNIFKAYEVPAGSMMPTLLIGDHFLCDPSYYNNHNPERGDLIIFKTPAVENKTLIKRIIGIQGDTIQIVDGTVYVNQKKLDLEFLKKVTLEQGGEAYEYRETLGNSSYQILNLMNSNYIWANRNYGPVTVPDGEYFVLGDNRDNSYDSRHWGMVRRDQIYGRPVFIYFSWDTKIPAWNVFGRIASIRFSRLGGIL